MFFCLCNSLYDLLIKIIKYGINLCMKLQIFNLFRGEVPETFKQHISLTELKKLNCF
jgi:hypothetical protein